jgi:hypothetical protein
MHSGKYSIEFAYNASTAEYREVTAEVFKELIKRKLEFDARHSDGITRLNAIRVKVGYRNTLTGFSPVLDNEKSLLIKKLDEIVGGTQ